MAEWGTGKQSSSRCSVSNCTQQSSSLKANRQEHLQLCQDCTVNCRKQLHLLTVVLLFSNAARTRRSNLLKAQYVTVLSVLHVPRLCLTYPHCPLAGFQTLANSEACPAAGFSALRYLQVYQKSVQGREGLLCFKSVVSNLNVFDCRRLFLAGMWKKTIMSLLYTRSIHMWG